MPASLISAKIRGVRSYSPDESKSQTIDFMPLTLIVGSNGTGKTTIIEALKFIISGEEPPLSDCRRNFVNANSSKRSSDSAQIELQFLNVAGEHCIARRTISSTRGATPSVTSCYKLGQKSWVTIHRQDEWNRTVPGFFNLPNKAILDSVVLCHQEQNLWCMGESSAVKQVFDKIFGCEQYKNEIKHIDAEIKHSANEISIGERDMIRLKERVSRKRGLQDEIDNLLSELKSIAQEVEGLNDKIEGYVNEKQNMADKVRLLESEGIEKEHLERRLVDLEQRYEASKLSLKGSVVDSSEMTDQDLKDKIAAHQDMLDMSRKRQLENSEKQNNLRFAIRKLEARKSNIQVGKLSVISGNLTKMTSIVNKMDQSEKTRSLETLIDDTLVVVDNLMKQFKLDDRVESPDDQDKIQAIDQLDEEIESKKNEIQELYKGQNCLADALSKSFELHDEYKKNQIVRDLKGQINSVHEKMRSIDANGSSNAVELVELRKQLTTAQNEELKLREKRSHLSGKKIQIEREISKLKLEFSSLSRANVLYAETLGKVACNRIVLDDLTKLKECFSKSIITFHDQMIVKINEVLRARWRQIYQGTDIETIELVAEEITRGRDKKSINYYIALCKNGQRMKMREKSSAGQKALASIILRMTLAELFVKDFAFIALDEPTANLDLPNILALARAIGSYVKRRSKKGANIQWIIITHDEQFLRALDAECSPYFFRTKLDHEGYSKILKISSRDLDLTNLPSQESNESDDNQEMVDL